MRDQVGGSTKRDFAAQSAMITEMYSKSTAHITYQASIIKSMKILPLHCI